MSEQTPTNQHSAITGQSYGHIPLWCTAFIILALIIIQAGRVGSGNVAMAEMATSGNEFTLVTTEGGNEEVLYVLEHRTGYLFLYQPTVQGIKFLSIIEVANIIAQDEKADGN